MKASALYFFGRIKPFLVSFLLLEFLTRLALTYKQFADLRSDILPLIGAFTEGMVWDSMVFVYFLIPGLCYLIFLPHRWHLSRADRLFTRITYGLFLYILIFSSFSEWIFWDEFGTRFNFIAVDYLVYTNEVIGNIRESYNLPLLLSIIGILALAMYSIGSRWLFPHDDCPLTLKSRALVFGALTGKIAMVVLASGIASRLLPEFNNSYVTELSQNGIHSLFAAFWDNELNYEQFYIGEPPEDANERLRDMVTTPNSHFLSDNSADITRYINNKGSEKHHNVIMVVMESMSGDFMGTFGNPLGLTPNLDALTKESLFFSKLYATGTRTVRGLEAVTLAIPPSPGQSIIKKPDNGNLFSLGFIFRERGYDTKFIYGGYGYFDNMNDFFAHNGFDIVDREKMAESEIHFANVWGIADEDLFSKVIKESSASYDAGKPFMSVVMTTSNHRPYTYPEGRIDMPSKSGRSGGVKYADYAIGKFLADARKQPWFNNTIFVIVADHTAGSAGKEAMEVDKYHIPLMIYAPKLIKPKTVDYVASQMDLAPTLLDLLNFSYVSRFYGVNILTTDHHRALISTYQKLGYYEDEERDDEAVELVVLKPVRKFDVLERVVNYWQPTTNREELKDAVSYYQSIGDWRQRQKAIPTIMKPRHAS